MGLIGGAPAAAILNRFTWPADKDADYDARYERQSKFEAFFGANAWRDIEGKTVVDFGCGSGREVIQMAEHGAALAIGFDIQERALQDAKRAAERSPSRDRCLFTDVCPTNQADVITSLDAFEHFGDPAAILEIMATILRPGGRILLSFGPTWLHPFGPHMPLPPWAHLVFTEAAIMRWRAQWKQDGATKYAEVDGGLNQMTIKRFERLVAASRLAFETPVRAVPIHAARRLHNRVTREFLTSVVQCRLVHRPHGRA